MLVLFPMAIGHVSNSPRNCIKLWKDTVLFYAIKKNKNLLFYLTVNLGGKNERGEEEKEGGRRREN